MLTSCHDRSLDQKLVRAALAGLQKSAGCHFPGRCEAANHCGGHNAAPLVQGAPALPVPVPVGSDGAGAVPEGG